MKTLPLPVQKVVKRNGDKETVHVCLTSIGLSNQPRISTVNHISTFCLQVRVNSESGRGIKYQLLAATCTLGRMLVTSILSRRRRRNTAILLAPCPHQPQSVGDRELRLVFSSSEYMLFLYIRAMGDTWNDPFLRVR